MRRKRCRATFVIDTGSRLSKSRAPCGKSCGCSRWRSCVRRSRSVSRRHPSSSRIGGLSITLRPDRIDELASGGELLIDYKVGGMHRPRGWLDVWPGRPRNPQLPLYGLAHAERLRALAYVVLTPGAVEYRGWSDGSDVGAGVWAYPNGVRIDLGDPGDWLALTNYWTLLADATRRALCSRRSERRSVAVRVHDLPPQHVLPHQRPRADRARAGVHAR